MKWLFTVLGTICFVCVRSQALQQVVTLSVILPGVGPTITVNNPSVSLDFSSSANYTNGVHSGVATNDHIAVSSVTGFQVAVRGTGDLANGSQSIPLSSVIVTPSSGSQTISPVPTYTATTNGLNTSRQIIISSTAGAPSAKFNIDYFAKGGIPYMGKTTGTYSASIIYSVTPN